MYVCIQVRVYKHEHMPVCVTQLIFAFVYLLYNFPTQFKAGKSYNSEK